MKLTRRSVLAGLSASIAMPAIAQGFTVTDALGRTVNLKGPLNRVITTFNYEEFTAVSGVEGWQRVVAMSRTPWEGWRPAIFSRYTKVIPNLQAMPDVGHIEDNTFSAEKVLAARPDVVLMSEWGFSTAKTRMAQIEAAGIPIVVIDYNAQSLERHLASTRALGLVMDRKSRSDELAGLYETQFRDILARAGRASGAKKMVYVELGQAGPDTIGNSYNGTMWGKIITTLGADNLATGRLQGPWGPLAAEAVLAANPDLIFMAGSSWVNRPRAVRTGYDADEATTRASLAAYASRPGWAGLKAVQGGGMHAIEHGLCRTLFDYVAMQYIGKQLYPEHFADVDPVRSFRDYHARYLPVPFSGTWMLPLKA
ncbi:MAG: ABC transporter substrate-binding protein [Methylobacterium sp.]|jgi:iron complex transport system substrate-binding protein|nr:ABC transporter substrate-binding protein [Methylobacterium sp.]